MMTLGLISGAALIMVAVWYRYWLNHARKFTISGYTAPDTSWFGRFVYWGVCRLATFLTVGPVKVIGGKNSPRSGRVVIVGNHQVQSDFAVARRAFGRHSRSLGASAQFQGFAAFLAAWLGVIPVTYETKEERAQGECACAKYLGSHARGIRFNFGTALALSLVFGGSLLAFAWLGYSILALISFLLLCAVLSTPGRDRCF